MWKKTLGSVFIIASAILYSSMYISAAIYGSVITSKSKEIFSTYLGFIGNGLIIPSIILFILGCVFILYLKIKIIKSKNI